MRPDHPLRDSGAVNEVLSASMPKGVRAAPGKVYQQLTTLVGPAFPFVEIRAFWRHLAPRDLQ